MKLPVSAELINYTALGFDPKVDLLKTKWFKRFVKLCNYTLKGDLGRVLKRVYRIRMYMVAFT